MTWLRKVSEKLENRSAGSGYLNKIYARDWNSLAEKFMGYLKVENGYTKSTITSYRQVLNLFSKFLRENHVSGTTVIDVPLIRKFLTFYSEEKKNGNSTISHKVSVLRSLFTFLIKEGYTHENPLAGVNNPKVEKRLPVYLSKEEMLKLLNAPDSKTTLGKRDIAILETIYACGARVSELVNLDIADVTLKGKGQVRLFGKGGKERMVPLTRAAVKAIKKYLRSRGEDEEKTLFVNRYGQRLSTRSVQNLVKRYAAEVGIKVNVTPHVLRHSFAVHILKSGKADLESIRVMLGHSSLATTQIYAQVDGAYVERVHHRAHPRDRMS